MLDLTDNLISLNSFNRTKRNWNEAYMVCMVIEGVLLIAPKGIEIQ